MYEQKLAKKQYHGSLASCGFKTEISLIVLAGRVFQR